MTALSEESVALCLRKDPAVSVVGDVSTSWDFGSAIGVGVSLFSCVTVKDDDEDCKPVSSPDIDEELDSIPGFDSTMVEDEEGCDACRAYCGGMLGTGSRESNGYEGGTICFGSGSGGANGGIG
jgi:hypothetical protein